MRAVQNIPLVGPKARDLMLDQDGHYRVLMSPYPIADPVLIVL